MWIVAEESSHQVGQGAERAQDEARQEERIADAENLVEERQADEAEEEAFEYGLRAEDLAVRPEVEAEHHAGDEAEQSGVESDLLAKFRIGAPRKIVGESHVSSN